MAKPRRKRRPGAGITRISVEGYKSLRTRQDLEIRPLTVIAGVNSSGKSSAIQPLLLLKQTIEAPYDPGPLQLDGPNVSVTNMEQLLSRTPSNHKDIHSFTIGITVEGEETTLTFGRDERGDLRVREMSGWFHPGQRTAITIHEGITEAELLNRIQNSRDTILKPFKQEHERLTVARTRPFLMIGLTDGKLIRPSSFSLHNYMLQREISRTIHLPALRGNPQRTYRTAAVEGTYPGTFEVYTAGVISAWQNREQGDKLTQLNTDLKELGLTSTVRALQLNDTQVELLVGRLPQAQRGRDRQLVNIADVGFGVSQTLPVIVALLAADEGQLVYLEQPEIHLHPRAQVAFARLVKRAVDRGVRVIVETHSSLFIRSVQTLVAQGQVDKADVALHWFTRDPKTGDTQITSGELDESGAFGDWPEDFDEVYLDTEAAYLDAAARKAPPS